MKLLNIIAFPATVVLGLLLMVAGFVPSISPATNSWLPLLGLAFPVLFLLMVLAFLYWIIQRKWRSLFALSCLLLNLGPVSLYVQWNDLNARYAFGFAAFDNAQVRHATADDTMFLVFGK